jgi:hypothetical protein
MPCSKAFKVRQAVVRAFISLMMTLRAAGVGGIAGRHALQLVRALLHTPGKFD